MTAIAVFAGCNKDDDKLKIQTLEGTIEKITINADGTGEITVVYFSEKQGQDIPGTGLVTNETEILINGAVAKLADIREGERVRGEVRIEKKNGKRAQFALKIHIDRPKALGSD